VCTCVAGDESLIEDEVRQKAASPPGRVPHLTLRLYACTCGVALRGSVYVASWALGGRDAGRSHAPDDQIARMRYRVWPGPRGQLSGSFVALPPRSAQAGARTFNSRISVLQNVSKSMHESNWTTRLER
jgi:hypothetical protein